MILAAHQPNFCPWLPFFDKMNKCDVFVMLTNVQFEKNGWQNRCQVNGKHWTMPVRKGALDIKRKQYVSGLNLVSVNEAWINAMAMTLDIDTSKIRYDFPTSKSKTDRIIQLCKYYECDQYLTNPEAMDKYLDENLMNDEGIEVVHHTFPLKVHVFEAIEKWGIQGVQKLLAKEKKRCVI